MISEDSSQAIEHGMAWLVQSGEIKPGLEIAYWHHQEGEERRTDNAERKAVRR